MLVHILHITVNHFRSLNFLVLPERKDFTSPEAYPVSLRLVLGFLEFQSKQNSNK